MAEIMLIGTHTLSPMVAVASVQLLRKIDLRWKELWLIGAAGALPDVLNPHIYLSERHISWSHSLVGWICFLILLIALGRWKRFIR